MKYPLDILNDYIGRGLIVKQDHPTLPLSIYNYSRTCQYDRLWDAVTLDCRGLVLDNEGNVVAKPFPKFFNMEELSNSEIPNESFEVFEKMDGSLGIAFYYNGDWIVATRGSFVSEQAVKATEMLKGLSILKNYPTTGLRKNWTYLFEIIYDENRIVCRYPFEGLVLLGAYDRDTLDEIEFETLTKSVALFTDVRVVRKYNGVTDFTKLKDMISNDAEGYVIRFKGGKRMKIKGEEYVRLHKIITNVSNVDIWELLRTGGDLNELLERVPDEFDTWVKDTVKDLVVRFENIKRDYLEIFSIIRSENLSRKEFAIKAIRYNHASILFSMLDGRDYDSIIWKCIRPKYAKPFRKDLDN